jgi:hypothetical protein
MHIFMLLCNIHAARQFIQLYRYPAAKFYNKSEIDLTHLYVSYVIKTDYDK